MARSEKINTKWFSGERTTLFGLVHYVVDFFVGFSNRYFIASRFGHVIFFAVQSYFFSRVLRWLPKRLMNVRILFHSFDTPSRYWKLWIFMKFLSNGMESVGIFLHMSCRSVWRIANYTNFNFEHVQWIHIVYVCMPLTLTHVKVGWGRAFLVHSWWAQVKAFSSIWNEGTMNVNNQNCNQISATVNERPIAIGQRRVLWMVEIKSGSLFKSSCDFVWGRVYQFRIVKLQWRFISVHFFWKIHWWT